MTEERVWYVNTNSQTYGPYTKEEVVAMLKDGNIQYSDYIFKEGFANWDYIRNVQEFDRRLINPGGDQPVVETPKEEIPVQKEELQKTEEKEGEVLWYVHDGEHQMGPYNADYIKESLDDKTIFWTYYVWRDGLDGWVQLKECKEFDRRKTPRGEKPVNVGITTDYNEIKKQAVYNVPTVDSNKELYGEAQVPGNYQYGITEEDQQELRGKYPVKAIMFLVVFAIVLFATVRYYPKLTEESRMRHKENKAAKLYDKAQKLIDQKKLVEGYDVLFDLIDMYPDTKVARKNETDLRTKESFIKDQLTEEARKIKTLMNDYIKKYGMLPNNAVDINYTPSFWLSYFADAYYKRDVNGKAAVMIKGRKLPVDEYMLVADGTGKEIESEVKSSDFDLESQSYIKLIYTGKKTAVKPLDVPQLLKKKEPVSSPPPVKKEKISDKEKDVDEGDVPPPVTHPRKLPRKVIKKVEPAAADDQEQADQPSDDITDEAIKSAVESDEQQQEGTTTP